MARFESVDEYIESFTGSARSRLVELRELSQTTVPLASEGLKWGDPAYWTDTILFVFSGHQRHANIVFTPSTLAAFAAETSHHRTGKGSVQLPYDQPMPADLLRRMIEHRVREHEEEGVGWR